MEELKAMFRVCAHIKKDGIRCNSPALKGGNFCFHHVGGSLRELTRARSTYVGPRLDFLYPGHRQAIQHNLFVVAQAMNDGKLELAMANTYNRIFATCERNLRRWETHYQTPGQERELAPIPNEAPDSAGENANSGPLKPWGTGAGAPCLEETWEGCSNQEQKPSVSSAPSVVNPSPDHESGADEQPDSSPAKTWDKKQIDWKKHHERLIETDRKYRDAPDYHDHVLATIHEIEEEERQAFLNASRG